MTPETPTTAEALLARHVQGTGIDADLCDFCSEAWPCREVLFAERDQLRAEVERVKERFNDLQRTDKKLIHEQGVMLDRYEADLAAARAEVAEAREAYARRELRLLDVDGLGARLEQAEAALRELSERHYGVTDVHRIARAALLSPQPDTTQEGDSEFARGEGWEQH